MICAVKRPTGGQAAVAATVLLGAWFRLPPILTHGPVNYDDGVFAAVSAALRRGDLPYREIIGTQGPFYYALLWLTGVVSGHWEGSARLAPFAAGVVLVALAVALARAAGGRMAAVTAGILVATSGSLLRATAPAESDGIAAAFGGGAVLMAAHANTRRGIIAAGVLAGAGLSVKNALAVPAAAACVWLIGRRHGRTAAVVAGIATAVTVVAIAAPFGVVAVARDSVLLHTKAGHFRPGHNTGLIRDAAWGNDRLLVIAVAATLVGLTITAIRHARPQHRSVGSYRPLEAVTADRSDGRAVTEALVLWAGGIVVVLLCVPHLWIHNLAAAAVPVAVLSARCLPDSMLVTAAAIALVPWQVHVMDFIRHPGLPTPNEAAVIAEMRAELPPGAAVVSDEPGLVAWAGFRVPPEVIDPSFVLFGADRVTRATIDRAASADGTCALLFWSRRFDLFGVTPPAGYHEAGRYTPLRRLYVRDDCVQRE